MEQPTAQIFWLCFCQERILRFSESGLCAWTEKYKTNMHNLGRNCRVDRPVIISMFWLLFTSKCVMWRGSSVIIVEKIGQTGPQQCPFVTMHWVRWMTQRHMAFISAQWTADFFRKLLLSSRSRGSMIRPGFTGDAHHQARHTQICTESCQEKNCYCV